MRVIVRRLDCPDCGHDELDLSPEGAYDPASCGAVVVDVPDELAYREMAAQRAHADAQRALLDHFGWDEHYDVDLRELRTRAG